MKYIKNIALSLLALTMFVSCDEGGDPDIGGTAVESMAGDWYVKYLVDGEDIYGLGYKLLSTYNTAANVSTEIWVDDHDLWPLKVKATSNTSDLTFSGTNMENIAGTDLTATITEGKILKEAATTSGGNISDSIYIQIEFSDDPGTIYTLEGYKRTGFADDEH